MFCFTSGVHAAGEQWRKDLSVFSVKTCSARMNIAKGLIGDITKIKKFLPVLTQTAKNQIKEELVNSELLQGEVKKQKLIFLTMTTKNTLNELHKKLKDILHNLNYILYPRCDAFELVVWIAIADEMLNSKDVMNYSMRTLAQRKVIELSIETQKQLRLDSNGNNCLWGHYIDTARLITQNVVTPLMLEELGGLK